MIPSRIRIPRPPQKSTTFMIHTPTETISSSGIGKTSFPPQEPDIAELPADFVPQIPRQDENVIGFRLGQAFWRVDRDMRAGQELPLLDRTAVDRVGEQVRPDAAVVKQRVALARGAVSGHRPSLTGSSEEEAEQVALDLQHGRREALVALDGVQASGLLLGQHGLYPLARFARALLRPRIDPERAAVGI